MAVNSHDDHEEVRLSELDQPAVGHEHGDVNVWAIGRFGIALVFLCIISLGLLFGVFKYFESSVGGSLPDSNVDARQLPPQPQLQRTPIQDLRQMRAAEDQLLTSYGWVDQSKGIVRLPISQAIDLLAKRGLPARAQTEQPAAGSEVSIPTEAGLGPKVNQPGGPLAGELK
jgi:hypothetical protein